MSNNPNLRKTVSELSCSRKCKQFLLY